jgi:hypothetical protein
LGDIAQYLKLGLMTEKSSARARFQWQGRLETDENVIIGEHK